MTSFPSFPSLGSLSLSLSWSLSIHLSVPPHSHPHLPTSHSLPPHPISPIIFFFTHLLSSVSPVPHPHCLSSALAAPCPTWVLPSQSPPTPTSASNRNLCPQAVNAALHLPPQPCSQPPALSLVTVSAAQLGAPMRQGTGMTDGGTSGLPWACCVQPRSPRPRAQL